MKHFALALVLLPGSLCASPCPHPARHHAPLVAFAKAHPCPATGEPVTHCPGYVIDHVKPLCDCGKDEPANMQWERAAVAKKKDRLENQLCEGKITKAQFDAQVRKL
jgi:hypothetical protein